MRFVVKRRESCVDRLIKVERCAIIGVSFRNNYIIWPFTKPFAIIEIVVNVFVKIGPYSQTHS